MKLNLPTWTEGDGLKADDLMKLVYALKRLANVSIVEGSGLELSETANGWTIGRSLKQECRYAVTTSLIPKWGSGPGKGTGTLYSTKYDTSGVATLEAIGTGVNIYNGSNFDVPSGRRVMVQLVNSKWHITVDFCPAT